MITDLVVGVGLQVGKQPQLGGVSGARFSSIVASARSSLINPIRGMKLTLACGRMVS